MNLSIEKLSGNGNPAFRLICDNCGIYLPNARDWTMLPGNVKVCSDCSLEIEEARAI